MLPRSLTVRVCFVREEQGSPCRVINKCLSLYSRARLRVEFVQKKCSFLASSSF